ncbi:MAG: serine hydrolase [Opitutus sp.]|nr:serine hydrolase [Opitutus sp.]
MVDREVGAALRAVRGPIGPLGLRAGRIFFMLGVGSLAHSSIAQPTVGELLEQKTVATLQAYAGHCDGIVGVAAIDLTTGRRFSVNGETVFAQASSIKIPLMIELFRAAQAGDCNLDEKVTLTQADSVGGSGHLREELAKNPVTLTNRDLIRAMIQFSDNTATNQCIALAGMPKVNALMDSLGLGRTRLQRVMLDNTSAAARDQENISTPLEMARLAELLYQGKFAGSAEMIEILKLVDIGWQLPDSGFRGAIPKEVVVAAKPGSVRGVQCETGIVFLEHRPFVLSVMGGYLGESSKPVSEVTKIVFAHFQTLAASNSYGNRVRP